MDCKRMVYLFAWATLIGLTMVFLRTARVQAVYDTTRLLSTEREIRQEIWQQQVALTMRVEAPGRLRERVAALNLPLAPVGREVETAEGLLAKHTDRDRP